MLVFVFLCFLFCPGMLYRESLTLSGFRAGRFVTVGKLAVAIGDRCTCKAYLLIAKIRFLILFHDIF